MDEDDDEKEADDKNRLATPFSQVNDNDVVVISSHW